ncbi:hypothetical protein [Stenotrophomonas sp. PS02289]|uniref:hypothetical protein n=1 Tax=Stenotrophomonas sp. PS02289 TaxID=2991422 RepID=UPI00249C37C9|nr:hypothetical protein [Stenotrophomonas sp. PS02289]
MQAVDSVSASGARTRVFARPDVTFAVIWLVLGLPWLVGAKAIPFDATQQFFPAVSFVAQQLQQLQLPWWNPYLFSGYPQVADPQMMTFQPSMVLPMMLAPQSLYWFGVVVMLHVLLCGLGGLRLARHYGLQALPQLVFALVLTFGAVAASRLQHTPMLVSYAWLPWLWLALSRLRHQQRWRDAAWAGLFGGLCSLQLTQVTYFIILGCALYALAAVVFAPGAKRLKLVLQLGAVGALAALISAPQWLSTLAWLPFTNRAVISLEESVQGATRWQTLATLLSGNVFEQGRGTYWGPGDITQDYLYIGAVPLALWLGWGAAVVKAQPRRARVALAIIVFAVAFALGDRTPLFPWLFGWLPGLDLFRRPADALFVVVPMAAWLSAQALQQALRTKRLQPHLPSLALMLAVAGYTLWLVLEGHLRSLLWLALSAGIGLWALRSVRRAAAGHARAGRLLLALLVVDMLVFNVGTDFNTSSAAKSVPTAKRSGGTQSAYRALTAELGEGIPERAAVFGLPALTNGAAAWGLPLVNGYNPLMTLDYQHMVGTPPWPLAHVQDAPGTAWAPDFNARLFDLLGLRWVVAGSAFPGAAAFDDQIQWARRDSVLPRVLNPRAVQRHEGRYPDPAAFAATDFATTLWLPADAVTTCPDHAAAQVQVTLEDYQASQIRLRYHADAPGWVVVNELDAIGWQASANGSALPIIRGNGLFRAICVPAGDGELTVRYSPTGLWKAAWQARATAQ